MVWCELVQCLERDSINFIRLSKTEGVQARKALVGRPRSTERPHIQFLPTQLTSLKLNSGEHINDYLSLAEMLTLNPQEADEKTSDTIFSFMVLKDLPAAYQSIVTMLNFGVQKQFKDIKQDLINFANTRCRAGSDVVSTAFH